MTDIKAWDSRAEGAVASWRHSACYICHYSPFTGCRGVPGRTTLPSARSSALYRLARLCDVTWVSQGGDTGRRYVKRGEGNAVFDR